MMLFRLELTGRKQKRKNLPERELRERSVLLSMIFFTMIMKKMMMVSCVIHDFSDNIGDDCGGRDDNFF